MIKLVSDLAQARDSVDRAIALGEAAPRLERMKQIILWGLTVAVVILSISYIHVQNELDDVQRAEAHAKADRARMLRYLREANIDRHNILEVLEQVQVGKSRASAPRKQ